MWLQRMVAATMLVTCAFASTTHATEHATGANVLVPQKRVINDDLAAAGSNVQMQGLVKGDVTAVGSNLTLSGPVKGDAMVAGLTVVINGTISDDLRAAGANVTVLSPVGSNAMLAGGNVVVNPAARIGRDADISGGTVQMQGSVGRNLSINAGEAQIASKVGGNVTVQADKLTLLPGALIRGNLVMHGSNAPVISPGAKVLGRVNFQKTSARSGSSEPGIAGGIMGFLVGWMARSLWICVLGMTMLALARPLVEGVAATAKRQFGPSLLAGFVTLVVVPVTVVILFATLIGIPLGLLLLAVHVVALLLSGVFFAYMFGEWVLQRTNRSVDSPYKQLAWGALSLAFLMSLPLVGWLVHLATLFVGLGALLLERWGAHSHPRAEDTSSTTRSTGQPHSSGALPA